MFKEIDVKTPDGISTGEFKYQSAYKKRWFLGFRKRNGKKLKGRLSRKQMAKFKQCQYFRKTPQKHATPISTIKEKTRSGHRIRHSKYKRMHRLHRLHRTNRLSPSVRNQRWQRWKSCRCHSRNTFHTTSPRNIMQHGRPPGEWPSVFSSHPPTQGHRHRVLLSLR